ncbi:MAG: Ppx/GppA family phosphatase, partial [Pseudomonadota bacterium]
MADLSQDGSICALHEACEITRIGQGVDATGKLAAKPIKRTLGVLEDYSRIMTENGVTQRAAIGTSALRDAQNGESFCKQAESLLGCPISTISGKREAELIFGGVETCFELRKKNTLVFDIGGGSTEFILSHATDKPIELMSLNCGAVRLTERFLLHDPPQETELVAAKQEISRALVKLPQSFSETPSTLIGVSGTATTLAT